MGYVVERLTDLKGKINKYKKKPVIIRAVKINKKTIVIKTREGMLVGYKGDYLIEGIKGEIYPCGKEIFNETYEKIKIKKH